MGLVDNSIDAIVTDPPYGLEFMSKEWDKLGYKRGRTDLLPSQLHIKKSKFKNGVGTVMGMPKKNPRCRKCGKLKFDHEKSKCHCPESNFDYRYSEYGFVMQAWHYTWAAEAYRVLKPGGHLLAMGGTRTFHRLTCALEDAGFEIRDCMMWLYGSGFPKSYNISKGFDRRAFKEWLDTVELDCCLIRDPRYRKAQARKVVSAAVCGSLGNYYDYPDRQGGPRNGFTPKSTFVPSGTASEGSRLLASLLARFWEPLNEAERHGIWQGIVGDHEGCDVGTPPGVRVSIAKYQPPNGTNWNLEQADNPDAPHIEPAFTASGVRTLGITAPSTPLAKEWEGFGSGLKPAWEPVVVARKPLIGTLCENAKKWGCGGLNIDQCRVGYVANDDPRIGKGYAMNPQNSDEMSIFFGQASREHLLLHKPQGRWPANLILSHSEDCVRVGMKRVRAVGRIKSTVTPYSSGRTMHISDTPDDGRNRWYADPDGYEQAEDWICVESCPVKLLDEQSGQCRSAGRYTKGAIGIGDKKGPASIPIDGLSSATYSDKGGASRFFKNVEPDAEWECVEDCPIRLLDEQAGPRKAGGILQRQGNINQWTGHTGQDTIMNTDRGSNASRFFKNIEPDKPLRFCYTAKASRAERTCQGTAENKEPTVKPVNLCRYLERLVARPGAVILDPFCGSGSFGVAAVLEGFNWIGVDNRLEACRIAKKRREWAIQEKGQPRLF